jgi:hypothetical protein
VFQIKLINHLPYMLSVDLRVDGLNVLNAAIDDKAAFREGTPEKLLLGGKDGKNTPDTKKFPSEQTMLGWVKTPAKQAEFTIVDYPVSVAGLKRATSDVGVISAVATAAWYGQKPIELANSEESPQKGVGAGPWVDKAIVLVEQPFLSSKPYWYESIRYDRQIAQSRK